MKGKNEKRKTNDGPHNLFRIFETDVVPTGSEEMWIWYDSFLDQGTWDAHEHSAQTPESAATFSLFMYWVENEMK